MKMSKFGKKIHGDNAKLKKGLKHLGWVMGHGWASHGGTWKMGGRAQNIALKTLHPLMGYVLGVQVAQTLKRMLGGIAKT
jgi:hypothetical protein